MDTHTNNPTRFDGMAWGGTGTGADASGTAPSPVKPVIRWAFYAFVFSILFEGQTLGMPVELTTLLGGVLVLTTLAQPSLFYRVPSAALWCFLAYLYVSVIVLLIQAPGALSEVLPKLFVLLQMLVLFWVAYNLMRYERIARNALVSLATGCAVVGAMDMLGLTTTTYVSRHESARLSANGLDPNQLAGILALGMLILIGLNLAGRRAALRPQALAWAFFALALFAIVRTESRGGMISFGLGLVTLAMGRGSVAVRTRNVAVVLAGTAIFMWMAFNSPRIRERFESTLQAGNMTGREQAFPRAWEMFLEKPLLGWGPLVNTYELGNRVRRPGYQRLTAHNLVLYILTATGILGAIPFFAGTWLCIRAAWTARGDAHGILPFALVIAILIADMSVDGIHWKQHWLVMAYALASGEFAAMRLRATVSASDASELPGFPLMVGRTVPTVPTVPGGAAVRTEPRP